MKYRKKPVVIEAIPCHEIIAGYRQDPTALPQWVQDAYEKGVIVNLTDLGLTIKTLEGNLYAKPPDMVIQGVKGELYPCKSDIFADTYEPAE